MTRACGVRGHDPPEVAVDHIPHLGRVLGSRVSGSGGLVRRNSQLQAPRGILCPGGPAFLFFSGFSLDVDANF